MKIQKKTSMNNSRCLKGAHVKVRRLLLVCIIHVSPCQLKVVCVKVQKKTCMNNLSTVKSDRILRGRNTLARKTTRVRNVYPPFTIWVFLKEFALFHFHNRPHLQRGLGLQKQTGSNKNYLP